ncbi:hypothetical protein AURMO_00279 [Aurantimicrobium photophilum]|uniref:Bacterial EndoU nuclease domain-containing protein n=2 Tax=Microbacteriaceae TaxID=85023 RepID=A0A2Z3S1H8_9MICO|nr:hypothetical protein AURMO_00279 [Aurantimicrobium photophilum]
MSQMMSEEKTCLSNLARMVFESFAHVPVTEELLRHVWEGEPNGHQGGHRSGLGREGKTEFPAHWTPDIVENAIRTILEKPQFVGHYGNDIVLGSNFRGIMVVVKLKMRRNHLFIDSAFPDSGPGVVRNDRGVPREIPLNNYILEA